jgi:hypothetical protein
VNKSCKVLGKFILALVLSQFSCLSFCSVFGQEIGTIQSSLERKASPYDNCQLAWTEFKVSADGDESKVANCTFRSREGTFFRVDRELVGSPKDPTASSLSRLIVRPEGFALLNGSDEDSLAVIAFGPVDEGKNRLFSERMFEATRRGNLAYLLDVLKQCRESGNCKISKSATSPHIELTQILVDPSSPDTRKYEYKYILDAKSLSVIRWREQHLNSSSVIGETVVSKAYENFPVPAVIDVRVTGYRESDPLDEHQVSRAVSYIDKPAPISDFAIAGLMKATASSTGVWRRRVIVLLIGMLLVGLYFGLRGRSRNSGKM